jgi:hypothetical protein
MQDMVEAKIDPLYAQALDDLMKREMPRFNIVADLFKPEETGSAPAAKPAAAPKPPAGGSVGAPPKAGK